MSEFDDLYRETQRLKNAVLEVILEHPRIFMTLVYIDMVLFAIAMMAETLGY